MKTTKCLICLMMLLLLAGCLSNFEKTGRTDILYYPTKEIRGITTNILDHNDKYLGYRLITWTKDGTQIADGIWKYKIPEEKLIEIKNGTFWLFEYKPTIIGYYKDGKLLRTTDLNDKTVDITKLKKKTNNELVKEGLVSGFSAEIK